MIITAGSTIKDRQGNQYLLDEKIGSGGFGAVFKAHRENDGHIFAVKIIQDIFSDVEAFTTFQKEMNQTKLLDSENVIKYLYVHDGNEFPEYPPYIIMEYTDGGTLRDLIENRNGLQFETATIMEYFDQLAHGMKCISEHLVHRDIKPENILNFHGVLKITDFGLSKISGESTKTMTFKGYGTSPYVAPEAWNNDRNTIQMDIYSMGIVFYELATLSYPYEKPTVNDPIAFRSMHMYKPVINPSSINKNLPPHVTSIIIRMLAKPTQNRFKNWDEIIDALEAENLPRDTMSEIVNQALSSRNVQDLQLQQKEASANKAIEEKEQCIEMAYAQYSNTILATIKEFADRFNAQYVGIKHISIKENDPRHATRFSTEVKLPSGNNITITGEVLFAENFKHPVRTFFDEQPRMVNYIPKCKNKTVILWCQLKSSDERGFNILLLENPESLYGDWFILENTVSGLSRENRPSPFGFTLSELPKEIELITAVHIYNSELLPFSSEKLLRYITDRI